MANFAPHCEWFLFDSKHRGQIGGTGLSFPWEWLQGVEIPKPFMLAGGIGPKNVVAAIEALAPLGLQGLDINSKIESSPGRKNLNLLRVLIENMEGISYQPEAFPR